MKMKSEREVTQLCPTLSDRIDYSPPGSSVHGIFQARVLECVDHNKLLKILQEMGIPDHLTCFLRNLCSVQEEAVRTGHGTIAWFQIGKGVCQGCILSPCFFSLYAEYIMRNAGLVEAEVRIKIRRNINNLRYSNDTFMSESEEELKSLLLNMKEESEKAGL